MNIIAWVGAFVNKFEKNNALAVKNIQNIRTPLSAFIFPQYLFQHLAQKNRFFLFLHGSELSPLPLFRNKCVVFYKENVSQFQISLLYKVRAKNIPTNCIKTSNIFCAY